MLSRLLTVALVAIVGTGLSVLMTRLSGRSAVWHIVLASGLLMIGALALILWIVWAHTSTPH